MAKRSRQGAQSLVPDLEDASAKNAVFGSADIMPLIVDYLLIGSGDLRAMSMVCKSLRDTLRRIKAPNGYAITERTMNAAVSKAFSPARQAGFTEPRDPRLYDALVATVCDELLLMNPSPDQEKATCALLDRDSHKPSGCRIVTNVVCVSFIGHKAYVDSTGKTDAYLALMSVLWAKVFRYVYSDCAPPDIIFMPIEWRAINSPTVHIHAPHLVLHSHNIESWVKKWPDFAVEFKQKQPTYRLSMCGIYQRYFLPNLLERIYSLSTHEDFSKQRPCWVYLNNVATRPPLLESEETLDKFIDGYRLMWEHLSTQHTGRMELKTLNLCIYAPVYTRIRASAGLAHVARDGSEPGRTIKETLEHVMVWWLQRPWPLPCGALVRTADEVDDWLLNLVTTLHSLKTIEMAPVGESVDIREYPNFVAWCTTNHITIVRGVIGSPVRASD